MEKIKGEASWKVSEHDEFTIDEDFLKELETVNVQEETPILIHEPEQAKKPEQKVKVVKTSKKKQRNKVSNVAKKKPSLKKAVKKAPVKKTKAKKKTAKATEGKNSKSKKTTKKKDDKMKTTPNKSSKKKKTTKNNKKKTTKTTKSKKVVKPKGEPKRKPALRSKSKKKKQKNNWLKPALYIAGVIIVIILLGFLFSWINKVKIMNEQEKLFADYNPNMSITVATINGFDLSLYDYNKQLAMLPAEKKLEASRSNVLEWIIEEELLMQKASELDIGVPKENVEVAYEQLVESSGQSESEFLSKVSYFGLNKEKLKELLERQAIVNQLFVDEINKGVSISDEEAKAFYDVNPELFKEDVQVTVKHLLIKNDVRSEKEAKTLIQELASKAMKGDDFCTLITENSEDPGSVNNCGEYTFGKGVMVPEFEEAAFNMNQGEYRIVKTSYGYHLIYKVSETKNSTSSFEEVKEKIKTNLLDDARLEAYNEYVGELKADSDIQIFLPQIMEGFGIDAEKPIMTQQEYLDYVKEQQQIAKENAAYGQ